MRVNMSTPDIQHAIKDIYFNGIKMMTVTSFDTDTGEITFFPKNPNGGYDSQAILVRGGIIQVTFKDGWSWDDVRQCFVHHTPAVEPPKKFKMRNFRET